MTDAELDELEVKAKAAKKVENELWDEKNAVALFHAAANPAVILELIAKLRQTRAERNWLAEHRPERYCPKGKWQVCFIPEFEEHKLPQQCIDCWLKAAKEAVCQKN